ncbi:MAG: lytic murein transglycosylase [Patescibacteria group bacterium]|nr:lytic murein transglycosylase [Patescibacteria group bacterium]
MVRRNVFKIIILLLIVSGFFIPDAFVSAQTQQQERQSLEEELERLEREIQEYEDNIEITKQQKKSLQNEIYILQNKIRKLDLQIYRSNRLINDLRVQIDDTAESIIKTQEDIADIRLQLGKILQRIYEEDRKTKLEVLLVGDQLSDFFDNLMALQAINEKNKDLLFDIEALYEYLGGQKQALESEKVDEEYLVKISLLQKEESKSAQSQSENLLEVTKGQESEYQKLLLDKKKQAAEIRSRIFELIGVPEAPTFGEALDIANVVSSQTGIRPAFLLAVLTQESNLGKNVGRCYLKNTSNGSGVVVATGIARSRVMKPSRDIQPFLEITGELGRDPLNTAVSCPLSYGYGGAMGPAQFIPSTWMAYRDEFKDILGKPADPWNVSDSFLASAVYLVDLGANRDLYGAEWCAAVSYFSGNCSRKNQIAYEFYGDSVRAIANRYEEDIKTLEE